MHETTFGYVGSGDFTTYHMTLAAILMGLFTTWAVGAFLGSQKVERAAIRGLVLLAISVGLAWGLLGIPPIPDSMIRAVSARLNLSW